MIKVKKYKSYIIVALVSVLISSSISVYATITYQASQINYNNTTLDLALDNLYTTQNTTLSNLTSQNTSLQSSLDAYNNLKFSIRVSVTNNDTSKTSTGAFNITSFFKQRYKYFKITYSSTNSYVGYQEIRGASTNGNVNLTENTKYNTADYSSVWVGIRPTSSTSNSNNALLTYDITLYN